MSTQNSPSLQSSSQPDSNSPLSNNHQYLRPAEYAQGRIPWALQPRPLPCLSEQELKDLQTWRREVAVLVNERIVAYETPCTYVSTNARYQSKINTFESAGSRIAGITELVEHILRYAHPVTHLIALGVCKRWRDIALYIIDQDVCLGALSREPRCPPVRMYDIVPSGFARSPITLYESNTAVLEYNAIHERNLVCLTGRCPKDDTDDCDLIPMPYLPGRISHRQTDGLFIAYEGHLADVQMLSYIGINALPESQPRREDDRCQWIDLSQFEINPLFTRLFDNQIQATSGIAEITLPPRKLVGGATGWQHIPEAYLEHLNLDLLTQPPVVSLDVSIRIPLFAEERPRPRKLLHIMNVKNEKGIRIGELLFALKKAYPLAIKHWIYWAKMLHAAINDIHWNQDVWIVDSAPKLCLSMSPGSEQHSQTSFYLACMYALPIRDQRQTEWMPESMLRHARLQIINTNRGIEYTQVPGY